VLSRHLDECLLRLGRIDPSHIRFVCQGQTIELWGYLHSLRHSNVPLVVVRGVAPETVTAQIIPRVRLAGWVEYVIDGWDRDRLRSYDFSFDLLCPDPPTPNPTSVLFLSRNGRR